MRFLPLFAALALVLASCSSNDPEDVVLPSRETLIERYGTLAPGTFRVRHPSARLEFQGTEMSPDIVAPTFYLKSKPDFMTISLVSRQLVEANSIGAFTWAGSYNGPEGPHNCSGRIYVLDSTSLLLRAVFAGSCGKVDPLSGPRNFELIEGGFAYVR